MVITPSAETFSMASAISLPMNSSPLETVPTRAMSSVPLTFWELALMAETAVSTALAMPFFITTGFAPAARFFKPSRTMACASSVAVVVPSPAASSISLAMVTPSLVISGAPNFLSSTTLRPLGPRVTLTVSARTLTPASSALRASSPDLISLDIRVYLH